MKEQFEERENPSEKISEEVLLSLRKYIKESDLNIFDGLRKKALDLGEENLELLREGKLVSFSEDGAIIRRNNFINGLTDMGIEKVQAEKIYEAELLKATLEEIKNKQINTNN